MSEELPVEKRQYIADGNKVKVKRSIPDQELSSKAVLETCDSIRSQVDNGRQQVSQIKAQVETIEKIEHQINLAKAELVKLEPHEKRMREIQESRAEALYSELSDGLIHDVMKEYKWDKALEGKTNQLQMFQQLQSKLARTQQVAEELAPSVIKKTVFTETFFNNPFVNETEHSVGGQ